MPNHSKATVLVGIFTDKVTHIWDDHGWIELSESAQKRYQYLYDLQKKMRNKKRKK